MHSYVKIQNKGSDREPEMQMCIDLLLTPQFYQCQVNSCS